MQGPARGGGPHEGRGRQPSQPPSEQPRANRVVPCPREQQRRGRVPSGAGVGHRGRPEWLQAARPHAERDLRRQLGRCGAHRCRRAQARRAGRPLLRPLRQRGQRLARLNPPRAPAVSATSGLATRQSRGGRRGIRSCAACDLADWRALAHHAARGARSADGRGRGVADGAALAPRALLVARQPAVPQDGGRDAPSARAIAACCGARGRAAAPLLCARERHDPDGDAGRAARRGAAPWRNLRGARLAVRRPLRLLGHRHRPVRAVDAGPRSLSALAAARGARAP